jgi:ABC-2 type transport system ATP-binding protein
MAILNKGKTVVQGSVSELLSSQELIVSVEADDPVKAKAFAENSGWRQKVKSYNDHHLDFNLSKSEIPALTKSLNEAGINIFSISYKRALEDYFLKLTTEPVTTESSMQNKIRPAHPIR